MTSLPAMFLTVDLENPFLYYKSTAAVKIF
jgi:hypothetical protein